ncbi:MAG: hypothetical protein PHR22_04005 [Candidatus Omnitrophica bacterium]|nr:hypothetical protein [Candidatus Omnitrophota bacterium]
MKIKEDDLNRKYRCAKCGYLTQRQAPPRDCPICRAGPEAFDDIGVDRSTVKIAIYNPKLI